MVITSTRTATKQDGHKERAPPKGGSSFSRQLDIQSNLWRSLEAHPRLLEAYFFGFD